MFEDEEEFLEWLDWVMTREADEALGTVGLANV